ncbi:hypothetical protein R1flu_010534 [Riccia fluitans]|uniref:CCHC-type domain-containing protein n=1 Tax=Riccia fluitans TaxID=41844 RepID=A0ABD1Z9F2_9MARC
MRCERQGSKPTEIHQSARDRIGGPIGFVNASTQFDGGSRPHKVPKNGVCYMCNQPKDFSQDCPQSRASIKHVQAESMDVESHAMDLEDVPKGLRGQTR